MRPETAIGPTATAGLRLYEGPSDPVPIGQTPGPFPFQRQTNLRASAFMSVSGHPLLGCMIAVVPASARLQRSATAATPGSSSSPTISGHMLSPVISGIGRRTLHMIDWLMCGSVRDRSTTLITGSSMDRLASCERACGGIADGVTPPTKSPTTVSFGLLGWFALKGGFARCGGSRLSVSLGGWGCAGAPWSAYA